MDRKPATTEETDTNYEPEEGTPHLSETRRVLRIFLGRKLAVIGFSLILILVITAIFANFIAPYDPIKMDPAHGLEHPSRVHLLGTDMIGRDTLSRIIFGTRTSLMVGIWATIASVVIGQGLGLIAAYTGGITYTIIMRFIDALMSIPMILMALLIASTIGGGLKNIIIALGVTMIGGQCRMMCGQALTIRENDYIVAGRSIGASSVRMMLRHIYPNAFAPLLVMTSIQMGGCILAEAGLSYLGIGVNPPQPAWGGMVNEGYKYLLTNPELSFAPGLCIALVVFGFNMMGDGLRDALDPRLRGTI